MSATEGERLTEPLLNQGLANVYEGSEPLPRLETDDEISPKEFTRNCRLLYTSHFLSAWNSRFFEFGAVLFLITIYPNTLLPVSVYALSRAASAALISPWIGSYIDRKDRLHVVRLSIVSQRLAVAISCVVFFLMLQFPNCKTPLYSAILLACLSVLACIEKLGSVMNTISVERDWVVVVAADNEDQLRVLNSQLRRIDLFCKLVGPLIIAFIDGASTRIAIVVTAGLTAISVLVEYFAIARVYQTVPALQSPKQDNNISNSTNGSFATRLKATISGAVQYCHHPAFLPSFSLALLYLTVLSFAGQMVTYLAALGASSGLIGVLRAVSALSEMSATWVAPATIKRVGSVRAGIWFINWQLVCVTAASVFLWVDMNPSIAITGIVSFVIASRTGLWGFDLSVQNIVQEEVEAPFRGAFSAQEFALQNIFEMLAFLSTIVFSRPEQFKYPALISAVAVGAAGILFAAFVRSRRGHLLHLSQCIDPSGHKHRDHHHWWMGSQPEEEIPQHESPNQD